MQAQADGNRVLVFNTQDGNWYEVVSFNHVSGIKLSPTKQAEDYANF